MSVSDWPSSPLDAADRAFMHLVLPPTPIAFDARGLPGLPQAVLPLDQLRELLLSDEVAPSVRDVVWRQLVTRARRDGPAWVVAVVGLAMPGLRRVAGLLAAGGATPTISTPNSSWGFWNGSGALASPNARSSSKSR